METRAFDTYVEKSGQALVRDSVACLQMNLGFVCNLSCAHCHVEAGPHRHEKMSRAVVDDCLRFVEREGVRVVDITGGAPEMNPHLRYLILELGKIASVETILLRSNLVILDEPEYASLPEFLLQNNVDIIASMPCYLEENVTAQRGRGVYEASIRILQRLNRVGFGGEGPKLHLVYNPGGGVLPGPQPALEAAYKENLGKAFGIAFNSLYTITNIPIGRFGLDLANQGRLDAYRKLLADNFNPDNLKKVMCRNMISVDWQGYVYDCDFNHVLQLPLDVPRGHIGDLTGGELIGKPVITGEHCFACTAGAGSSCQGSLN
ncbi:arsenosugar biosynthesis radical SAM (seleno)protein ArsS [Geobacter sp. AOG2]|uniref:arsenosugar biosynthesis radical SAM (seleno)protein ArsS n=1 Tax=Geobacter sp. AOG2 TaxID=1566347 RepID=UPI001CC37597|nr:arsenosugar biosynthesis radical SAM (seleno)protein ArsS [Geobacter sp. AOG2]GFE59885.1 radical SAM/Cys-rich domain protein [Geobacter sp. AOG2]